MVLASVDLFLLPLGLPLFPLFSIRTKPCQIFVIFRKRERVTTQINDLRSWLNLQTKHLDIISDVATAPARVVSDVGVEATCLCPGRQ